MEANTNRQGRIAKTSPTQRLARICVPFLQTTVMNCVHVLVMTHVETVVLLVKKYINEEILKGEE